MGDRFWQIALAIGAFLGGRAVKAFDERSREMRELRDGMNRLVTVTEVTSKESREDRERLRSDLNRQADGIKKELHEQVSAIRAEIQQVRMESERRIEVVERRVDEVADNQAKRLPRPTRLDYEGGCLPPPG